MDNGISLNKGPNVVTRNFPAKRLVFAVTSALPSVSMLHHKQCAPEILHTLNSILCQEPHTSSKTCFFL